MQLGGSVLLALVIQQQNAQTYPRNNFYGGIKVINLLNLFHPVSYEQD